jgi:chemotaxis response regulator CheB
MPDAVFRSNVLQSGNRTIKVLLADDSEIMRRAIRNLLRSQPEIELVGEAADFPQTIQMMKQLTPEVIVMDVHMPKGTAATFLDLKSRLNHGSRMLAISVWNDEDTKKLADSLGTFPLLDKMELADKLIPTIMQLVSPKGPLPA